MSYINQLTLTELSLNSEAYGATSNATFSTDDNGDIILSPSTAGAVYASNSLITPEIYLGSSTSSVPTITTDSAGDINLNTVSGTVNIYGSSSQVISAPNGNLTIECGSSTTPASITVEAYNVALTAYNGASNAISFYGNTTIGSSSTSKNLTVTGSTTLSSASVSGSTTLGTSSTAISNIQFGSYTFANVVQADAGSNNYNAGSTINLPFTPTAITFGVSTNNTGIIYQSTVAYEGVSIPSTAPSGTVYSFAIYLYLPDSNGDNSVDYYVNWIAIA
jgi:hypothetical protein